MKVTLEDGLWVKVYDTDTGNIDRLEFKTNVLRLHVVDTAKMTAEKHIGTTDKELIDRILGALYKVTGRWDHGNTWIRIRTSRKEFWPADSYRRIAEKDLQSVFGDKVKVTGTSLRYIMYLSDDSNPDHSPDKIGIGFGNYPIIYKGYAVATVFTVGNKNPLSPGNNVIYWLTEPMWNGFHMRKRRVPKQFPGRTGFVATYWCQRAGYETYGKGGIDIAAMTQGHSLASWSITSLRQYWIEKVGKDIFADIGKTFSKKELTEKDGDNIKEYVLFVSSMLEKSPKYGVVGAVCKICGQKLNTPYGTCPSCGCSIDMYSLRHWCRNCGKPGSKCKESLVLMGHEAHNEQYQILYKHWNSWKV